MFAKHVPPCCQKQRGQEYLREKFASLSEARVASSTSNSILSLDKFPSNLIS